MIGKDFCHAHRNMTSKSLKIRWFKKYILTSPVQFTFINQTKKKEILWYLESGFVTLTKSDIQRIPLKQACIDIYILLLEHNFAQCGDHPRLERSALWFHEVLIKEFPFPNYPLRFQNGLGILKQKIEQYLITYSGLSFYRFLEFVGMASLGRQNFQQRMVEYIPTLLETEAAKELSWFSYDELDKIRKEWLELAKAEDHPLMRCLTERWLPDIKELYQTEKQIQRIKMDHCKEEMMAVCWHPDRVSKLLYAGIDPCDM